MDKKFPLLIKSRVSSQREPTRRLSRSMLTSTAVVALLALSACSSGEQGATDEGGSGEGLPVGATKEQFVEALADIENVQLTLQSPAPPGASLGSGLEAYAASVEEWSGGKITFEIAYSNSIVPSGEAVDGLADGRVDISMMLPVYEPQRFPGTSELIKLTSLADMSDPLNGPLSMFAAVSEATWSADMVTDDIEREGVRVLFPAQIASPTALGCVEPKSSLRDMQGLQTRIAAGPQASQVEALGMTPVTMLFTEVYEGLQRGTMNCLVTTFDFALSQGVYEVANEWSLPSGAAFSHAFGQVGIGTAVWDSLPLAAQQLLHDRLVVYIEELFHGSFSATQSAIEAMNSYGGGLDVMGGDAVSALQSNNKALADSVTSADGGSELVSVYKESLADWQSFATQEYGKRTVLDFHEGYSRDAIDLSPYVEKFRTEILDPNRPGEIK